MNQAQIEVNSAQILFSKPKALDGYSYTKRDGDDLNSTFYMSLDSTLKNTGPFIANIQFHNPIQVQYNGTTLGEIYLYNQTHIAMGYGTLDATTPFVIKDTDAFANFTKHMLVVKEFSWTLVGKLDITALTRTATVNLNKQITINGMNGFPDVKIHSFKLPGDAAEGGIQVELGTILNSPSPIGVQLGLIQLKIGYEGTDLGHVSAQEVQLRKGDNEILLKGRLVPQNKTVSLEKVGQLFSNYVSGQVSQTTALGVSCAPDGTHSVTWLSKGFEAVRLNVDLVAENPLKIINAVSMGQVDLAFNEASPYAPRVTAPNVVADFHIPFGFSLNITQVTQSISLGLVDDHDFKDFAMIEMPYTPSSSDQGKLGFAMKDMAIDGISDKNRFFDKYVYSLAGARNYTFGVSGNATAQVSTPIGPITLGGISYSVPTSLRGLQFLNSSATIIQSVDVTGGALDGLILAINVTMENPSDVTISTGDVYFHLTASDVVLGLVTLKALVLKRGSNTVSATASFDPKSSAIGQALLSNFVMGNNSDVHILGFDRSTTIGPLVEALSSISITSTLPSLKAPLIQGAKLDVSPDTNRTGLVGVKVSIANPFSAGLLVTQVMAATTFKGTPIGNINQDISSTPFVIPGHSTAESQDLSMAMNIEPAAIALLLRQLAVDSMMDTRALDALFALGGFHVAGQQDVSASSSLFANFNISDYTLQAMRALKVDLSLSSGILIGQYSDKLDFSQKNVAVVTDNSILHFIPIVGQKIVQQIVDGALLTFQTIIVSAPTDAGFTVQMKGSITQTGPMDAAINFPTPLTIYWQGAPLGTVSMPTILAKADMGANFDVTGEFTITNQDFMAQFVTHLINDNVFQWNIITQDVSVTALGFTFNGISMGKTVDLTGCNGFKDAVTIQSFDLPSDDPNGGITLTAQTMIKNPSQVGFNLSGVTFETYFNQLDIGILSSTANAFFPPQGAYPMAMKGRLIPQSSVEGLSAVTRVFENYLNASTSTITVKGVSGSGAQGQVGWLTKAFQTLTIDNVVLPGPAIKPVLIPSINLKELALDFTRDVDSPASGSNDVQAQLKNPFGFPLSVVKLDLNVEVNPNEAMATLLIPEESASTSASGLVKTSFSNVPFKVTNHEAFSNFIGFLTSKSSATLGLKGLTNALTHTAVGDLQLNGIQFDVQTFLNGLNNFGGKISIESLVVSGATKDYLIIDLVITLDNPSNITIVIGDINFDIVMNEFDGLLGRTYLKDVTISPGTKRYNTQFHLGEGNVNAKAVSQTLGDYLTAAQVPLKVKGTAASTTLKPLRLGLSTIQLDTVMTGIQSKLIQQVAVSGGLLGILLENKASAKITLQNPLGASFGIAQIDAQVTFSPSTGGPPFKVGTIHHQINSPQIIPAHGNAQTDAWPVSIDPGPDLLSHLKQLLGLLSDSRKYFYVEQNVTVSLGDGYQTELYYYQDQVSFSVDIDGLSPILGKLEDLLKNIGSLLDPAAFESAVKDVLNGGTGLLGDVVKEGEHVLGDTVKSGTHALGDTVKGILSDGSSKETKTNETPKESTGETSKETLAGAEKVEKTKQSVPVTTTQGSLLPFL
ncbi:hypothetical protein G6F56_001650 [Rhizopus delemar]|nr:hypothetical protein G6F56_001650 [Rhizopus delemar]